MRLSSLFGLRLRHRSITQNFRKPIKNHQKALEKGNQKQHHHQQSKQKSLEQVKRDGERIRQGF